MSDNKTTVVKDQNVREKFTVTRQIDADVEEKVDRRAFQEAALLIELPEVIAHHEFVFITLICQATDEGNNEIWEQEGGAYITITLPYDFVLHHATEVVTEKLLTTYQDFVQQIEVVPPISSLEADE
jgi:hypothetical protein